MAMLLYVSILRSIVVRLEEKLSYRIKLLARVLDVYLDNPVLASFLTWNLLAED